MNRNTKTKQLQQQLLDAQDGKLSKNALQQLEMEVKAHDAALWNDHLWMLEQQSEQGVFSVLAKMGEDQPETGAIRRLHNRIDSQKGNGAEWEEVVWSWFRRYVLTFGIILIVLLAGLQSGGSGGSESGMFEQMEAFLGWDGEIVPDLDHWLYDDFANQ